MESPVLVAIRTFIMLAFLIFVPLVAIFGRALPEAVQGFMDGRSMTRGQTASAAPPANKSPAPPANPADRFATPVNVAAPAQPMASAAGLGANGPTMFGAAPATPTPVTPVSHMQPIAPAGTHDHHDHVGRAHHLDDGHAGHEQPAHHEEPIREAGSGQSLGPERQASNLDVHTRPNGSVYGPPAGNVYGPPAEQTRQVLPVPAVEERLRTIGATYYRLEHWGGSDKLYRFHCTVEPTTGPGLPRYFQAIGPSAETVMNDVLEQADSWAATQR